MSFFDTTPLGRILNRFSKDVDIVDVTIPVNLRALINQVQKYILKKINFAGTCALFQSLIVAGTLIAICYAQPIFISVVIPILIAYYLLQKFYVTTARQARRKHANSPFF